MPENNKKLKVSRTGVTLKYCFKQIMKYKKSYFILSVINIGIAAIMPFPGIMMSPVLINELMDPDRDFGFILLFGLGMTALSVGLSLLNSVISVHVAKSEDLFFNKTREEVASRCMEIDFALTENKAALDQIQKARDGIEWSGCAHYIFNALCGIISNALRIFGVIAVLIFNAPFLLLIIGILMIISTIINHKKNVIDIKYFSELSQTDRIFGHICWEMEDFRYGKDIRLYDAVGMMVEKSSQQIQRLVRYWEKINDKKYPLSILDIVVSVLRDFGTYFYLGALAIMGKITVGTFSQLVIAGGTLNSSMQGVIWGFQEVAKRSNYFYEIISFMEYPAYLEKGTRKVENKSALHEIEFKNVCFSYPNTDVTVLNNVLIKMHGGEKLSVVGLNGAGKTTFIKLLCRLYDVDSGEILLDGINIRDYDYEDYMKLFAVVFQDFKLLAFSAKDNILLGKDDSDETVDAMFGKAGLLEKINALPDGKDTMMFKQFDKKGTELSGGEQQKMAIARALYKNAPFVILDEPTAALDPVAEYEIYKQFNDLVQGKTAVYISHRLSSCKFCERIAVFSEGTIKELGSHDELVRKPDGIYAEMFKAQAQYYI